MSFLKGADFTSFFLFLLISRILSDGKNDGCPKMDLFTC